MPATRTFSPKRLRTQREAAGFSRAQVAIAICRSWGAIYQFERGHLTPGAEALARMADLFGCSIDDFYAEDAARV